MNEISLILQTVTLAESTKWLITFLAFVVSLLTLYNAARLRTGILAVATYASGAGMLCVSTAFLLLVLPGWVASETATILHQILLLVGFLLLGFGSYKIYKMSRV